MFKYYKGKRVNVVRYFALEGIHYSTFMDNGKEVVVETSKLEDHPTAKEETRMITSKEGIIASASSFVPDGEPDIKLQEDGTVDYAAKGHMEGTTLEVNAKGVKISHTKGKIELDGETAIGDAKVIDTVNVTDTPVEIKAGKVVTALNVIAINKSNKETNLGEQDKLAESPEVKRLALDPEAIVRVLEGAQKQHKGYKFKVVEG